MVRTPTRLLSMLMISCAALGLEIAHIRIFSFLFWHHLSYAIVTTALFGFSLAGVMLSCSSKLRESPLLPGYSCLILAALGPLSIVLLSTFQLDPYDLLHPGRLLLLAAAYAIAFLPYLFAGLAILSPLSGAASGISILYGANLAGSAFGCLFGMLLIRPLGAKGLVVALSLLSMASGILSLRQNRAKDLRKVVALSVASFACLGLLGIVPLRPCSSKYMAHLLKQYPSAVQERSVWDPICKLDVVEFPGLEKDQPTLQPFASPRPVKGIFQDGDASTLMTAATPEDLEQDPVNTQYSLGYALLSHPKVLVIGTGGGRDVLEAVLRKASSVIGVEINPTIVQWVTGPYAQFVGGIFSRPEVRVAVGDGRWFVESTTEIFDLIQISGIDTQAALASGAYVLSENYLYTVESFQRYLDKLSDQGLLSMGYLEYTPPRSSLRIASLASQALVQRGVKDPGQHIVIASYPGMVCVLVKKSPFASEELDVLDRFVSEGQGLTLVWLPGRKGYSPFAELFQSFATGQQKRFYEAYPMAVHPTTDDSPFFFSFFKWEELLKQVRIKAAQVMPHESIPIGLMVLGLLVIQGSLGCLLLILGPLLFFHRKGLSLPGTRRWLPYFVAVGAGYMLIEICLMQRLVLLLAHPTTSISITLFSLLLFSGLGSLISGRIPARMERQALWIVCVGLAVLYPVYSLLLRAGIPHLLSLPMGMRAGLAMVLVLPLGLLMGMPFPLGLRSLSPLGSGACAWALGANGAASVMFSILSIVIALQSNFTVTTWFAGAAYLIAGGCAATGLRKDGQGVGER